MLIKSEQADKDKESFIKM